jgi:hypothetical protein
MLICTGCHIEYEGDKKFCSRCGQPLAAKEDAPPQQKETKDEGVKQGGKPYCPICKITYEFGDSCINCGAPLGGRPDSQTNEAPKSIPILEGVENNSFIQEKEEPVAPPKERLICPHCKIFYEKMKTCIRCGADLVAHLPEKEGTEASPEQEVKQETKEETKQEVKKEVKKETPQIKPPLKKPPEASGEKLVCPNCNLYYRDEIICQKCGSILVEQASLRGRKETKRSLPDSANDKADPLLSPRVKETSYPYPLSEQTSAPRDTDDIEKRKGGPEPGRKNYKRLFLQLGSIGIMVIAGGYFLWLTYSYFTSKGEKVHGFPQEEKGRSSFSQTSAPSDPSPPTGEPQDKNSARESTQNPSASSQASATANPSDAENPDSEGIKSLLENIRKANLQKDIDLFMACYASDFKDRDDKRKTTLKFWRDFSYDELSYDIKKLSITGKTANAKVEWLIKYSSKNSNRYEENKMTLDATFKKEGEEWKIKETKPVK